MRFRGLSLLVLFGVCLVATILIFPQHPSHSTPAALLNLAKKKHPAHPRPTTTTTTIAPGNLPQTKAFPSASDPQFIARMNDLVRAAATDQPRLGAPAFFPLAAYIQVKAIADPVTDWNIRLFADYDTDIGLVHHALGPNAPSATFLSVSVPAGATWVKPGVELNKGSYWRVFGTVVYCKVGTSTEHFVITSMISWRGEWYVVHLGVIR